jgi:hypothetical protein
VDNINSSGARSAGGSHCYSGICRVLGRGHSGALGDLEYPPTSGACLMCLRSETLLCCLPFVSLALSMRKHVRKSDEGRVSKDAWMVRTCAHNDIGDVSADLGGGGPEILRGSDPHPVDVHVVGGARRKYCPFAYRVRSRRSRPNKQVPAAGGSPVYLASAAFRARGSNALHADCPPWRRCRHCRTQGLSRTCAPGEPCFLLHIPAFNTGVSYGPAHRYWKPPWRLKSCSI